MKKDTFQLDYDHDTKIACVFKSKDEMTKNHQETKNPIVTGFMPQILNSDGTVNRMCPVHSFENYLNHLNEKNEFLWQMPNQVAFDKGNPVWYKNKRVRENTLGTFMSDLCTTICCEMGQNDTIGKIELNPSSILSSKSANSRNDIQ